MPGISSKKATNLHSEATLLERGAVLLETTFVLFVLVILVAGTYDIGRMLNSYTVLTQVCAEATRFASRVRQLEAGEFTSSDPSAPAGHQLIHARTNLLLAINNAQLPISNVTVTSTYRPATDSVDVSVGGMFDGFFPAFAGWGIWANHSTPYLARSAP